MNKKTIGSAVLVFSIAMILLSGCTSTTSSSQPTSKPTALTSPTTMEELAKHNKREDCWILIEGKVYDITSYIALGKHNPAIVQGCGIDATTLFNEKHSAQTKTTLENYFIGTIAQ